MKNTAFIIQGMAGFDAFLAGIFENFSKYSPQAIATEGASIAPAIWYSGGLNMKDYIKKIKQIHAFSTPPACIFTGNYYNGYFHSTHLFDVINTAAANKTSSLYTYHYQPDVKADEEIRKKMRFPVYTGIVNLLTGEHEIKDLREFPRSKYYRWLGGRIPYFTPTTIDGQTFVEDYYRNPPIKQIIKNKEIKKIIFIRSFAKKDNYPKNYLEFQDRDINFTMNSYFDREIEFIDNVNEWVKKGILPKEDYRIIEKLSCSISPEPLDYLDFTPAGIEKKYQLGLEKGKALLKEIHL